MLNQETRAALAAKARRLRRMVVTMVHQAGDGHPGPALSCADIVTALYYRCMRIDPSRPRWEDRDRFILSKGHACTVLYAALADLGYFPESALPTFRSLGSILQGHPDMNKTPGVDMTSGSLGHGIPVGAGMAAAAKLAGRDFRVFTIVGDGELNEGIVWEGAMAAARMGLDNLTAFVDCNGFQSGGTTEEISGMSRIRERFEAFGWSCREIDGHDFAQIVDAVEEARAPSGKPTMILARTVKGKGVSFMENNNDWHKGVPDKDQLARALADLADGREP